MYSLLSKKALFLYKTINNASDIVYSKKTSPCFITLNLRARHGNNTYHVWTPFKHISTWCGQVIESPNFISQGRRSMHFPWKKTPICKQGLKSMWSTMTEEGKDFLNQQLNRSYCLYCCRRRREDEALQSRLHELQKKKVEEEKKSAVSVVIDFHCLQAGVRLSSGIPTACRISGISVICYISILLSLFGLVIST